MKEGKVFLDTNLIIYLFSNDEPQKRETAKRVLESYNCVVSTQILNEVSNVWFKKFNWCAAKIKQHLDNIESVTSAMMKIHRLTINQALTLKERYGYSYYDCLILSSALESGCEFLFSEDMSDGQVIEGKLKIKNPFQTQ